MVNYYSDNKNYLKLSDDFTKNPALESAKQLFLDNFDNALVPEIVLFDGIEEKVLIKHGKKSEDKKVILKPDFHVELGTVVTIKESNYLTVDFLGEGIYEVYPTATLKLCNSTFPIETDKTSVLIGYDDDGRPVYQEQAGQTIQEPCIVETTYYTDRSVEQLPLPEGHVNITIQYQVADSIKKNEVFEMYGENYKIRNIDYTKRINDKGTMIIRAELVQEVS